MSSHVSLLFGAIPAEVKTWQAFPRSPSLAKATEFLTFLSFFNNNKNNNNNN